MAKKKATIIAIANQKGGTAKTTTCENLGIGLADEGKDVLLVDVDPQGSLTIALGNQMPDEMEPTLADMMERVIQDEPILPCEGVLKHPEGVDLMPGNIALSGLEASLVNVMSRETILKQYLNTLKDRYDYILLDGSPSLGMLTINMLAAADSVLVPVQAQYLSAKGLEQLLGTVSKVRRQINPKLRIEGVLLTMVDQRTNYAKEIAELIRETYGKQIKIYKSEIPRSIRAAEISAAGRSIFRHDPKGKVAEAYRNLTKEVLADGNRRLKRSKEECL
ncbi:MAG: ParA family protein [Eubacterium sp.]|nr:ParA family protein [Eubacterium sp.]